MTDPKRHPQQPREDGFTDADRQHRRYMSPPRLTSPTLRKAFEEYGITPRGTRPEDKLTRTIPRAGEPPPPWVTDMLVPALHALVEREDARDAGRDSIADAERNATDASALGVQTIEATVAQAKRWAKFMVPIVATLMALMASCGAGIAGYVGQSKGTADATKGVVDEAAKKAAKEAVAEAPAAKPDKVFVYVPVPAPTAPLPASFEGGL